MTSEPLVSYCDLGNPGGMCTPAEVAGGGQLLTTLVVLGYPGTDDWIALMCGNFKVYSRVIPTVDVAKTDFQVTGVPTAMTVNQPVTATVHATISALSGQLAAIPFTDTVKVTVPADCTATPSVFVISDTLAVGESRTYARDTTIVCSHHSNHEFTFTDQLVGPTSARDLDMSNNEAMFVSRTTVWEDYDLSIDNATLECAATTSIGVPFDCLGRATVTNGTTNSDVPFSADLTIASLPDDCTVGSATVAPLVNAYLPAGATGEVTGTWSITCSKRSFHSVTMKATAAVGDHLRDSNPANNTALVTDQTEVFQAAALSAVVTDLRCTERERNTLASECVATVAIANAGTGLMADDIQTLTTVSFDVADDCTATLTSPQPITRTLGIGDGPTLVTASVSISCTAPVRHSVMAMATVTNDPVNDPHAPATASDGAWWHPIDVKPTSYPSSFNLTGGGSVPFAILATADFDPTTEIVPGSIRIGVPGKEIAITDCRYRGEDRNADGRLDVVCHVPKADLVAAGVTSTTTWLSILGLQTDGTDFFGQDDVKIEG